MPVSIGPRIQVDGEEDYRRKINEIITQGRALDAEMRALTATFDDETTKQEKATKSSKLLNDQLEVARERTRLVRDMTEQSTAKTGENSTQTLKWREVLAAAKEEQARLERAVRENTAAMQQQEQVTEESGEKMVGLGDAVGQVAGKLGINLPEGAKNALNGMAEFSAGSVIKIAAVSAGVAGAIKAVKELSSIAAESSEKADALLTRAAQTSLDPKLLQQLDYAQRFLDFEGIDKTLVKLTQSMGKARDGAAAQTKAFQQLGVSIYDENGKLRNNWDTFLDVIDALGAVGNETEQDTLANDLLGKSYAEMKPLVDAGTGALADYMKKANALGLVLDEKELAKLGQLNDVLEDNTARWEALKDRLALMVAPAMSGVISLANDAITAVSNVDFTEAGLAMARSALGWNPSAQLELMEAVHTAYESQKADIEQTGEALTALEEKQQQTAEASRAATAQMQESVAALAESYQQAYDAAYQSLDGQFSLWEKAAEVQATSTESMIEGLYSQLNYWYDYAANFDSLVNRNVEGVEDLAQNFTDGSAESAAALAGLRGASDEEIAAIIRKMDQTKEMKDNLARRFAALETGLAGNLQNIRTDFGNTMTQLQSDAGAVDFSAFEKEVDEAFRFLEERARTAVSYADGQMARISGTIRNINAMTAVPVGRNAAGTDYWRGGLTWVGEQGPELISLPRGTQIFSAEQSQAMTAAAPAGAAAGGTGGESMADAVRKGVYEAINELGGMPQSQGPARFYVGDTEIARATYDAHAEVENEHGISMIS